VRLFVFARHAESIPNVAHVLNSDPSRPAALTPRGRRQARRLGAQIGNLEVDLAFCTRFPRTRQTAEIALRGRNVPLLVEPGLDEIQAGIFDGAPIAAYWAWKEQHAAHDRFPQGESLDEAVRRYVDALHRLLARTEAVMLIVVHKLALRYIATAAAEPGSQGTANRDRSRRSVPLHRACPAPCRRLPRRAGPAHARRVPRGRLGRPFPFGCFAERHHGAAPVRQSDRS
jgi:broad specificity phosphatase PhoE